MRFDVVLVLFLIAMPAYAACKLEDGKPIVLNDAAPCLREASFRDKVESEAIAGNMRAASLLADFYLYGAGDNEKEAVHWLRVYVKNGAEAPINLGQLLLKSDDQTDVAEGEQIVAFRARRGDKRAAEVLADHLIAVDRNDEARAWYENAAFGGSATAMSKLGELLLARDEQSARALGVMWTLVAAHQFADGTFKHEQLVEKARSSASKFGLNTGDIEPYSLIIARMVHKKSQKQGSE